MLLLRLAAFCLFLAIYSGVLGPGTGTLSSTFSRKGPRPHYFIKIHVKNMLPVYIVCNFILQWFLWLKNTNLL